MLALEDAFDIEFPDQMLKASVFQTVASIADAVGQLQAGVV
jgi:acyl carrier protein